MSGPSNSITPLLDEAPVFIDNLSENYDDWKKKLTQLGRNKVRTRGVDTKRWKWASEPAFCQPFSPLCLSFSSFLCLSLILQCVFFTSLCRFVCFLLAFLFLGCYCGSWKPCASLVTFLLVHLIAAAEPLADTVQLINELHRMSPLFVDEKASQLCNVDGCKTCCSKDACSVCHPEGGWLLNPHAKHCDCDAGFYRHGSSCQSEFTDDSSWWLLLIWTDQFDWCFSLFPSFLLWFTELAFVCPSCPSSCCICTPSDFCLICKPGNFMLLGKWFHSCPSGFYGDAKTENCLCK